MSQSKKLSELKSINSFELKLKNSKTIEPEINKGKFEISNDKTSTKLSFDQGSIKQLNSDRNFDRINSIPQFYANHSRLISQSPDVTPFILRKQSNTLSENSSFKNNYPIINQPSFRSIQGYALTNGQKSTIDGLKANESFHEVGVSGYRKINSNICEICSNPIKNAGLKNSPELLCFCDALHSNKAEWTKKSIDSINEHLKEELLNIISITPYIYQMSDTKINKSDSISDTARKSQRKLKKRKRTKSIRLNHDPGLIVSEFVIKNGKKSTD